MERALRKAAPDSGAQIIDFDEALLDSCTPELRSELLTEAQMLAQAFAPEGRADQLQGMARSLSEGQRDGWMERARARRLAAALRHLARDSDDDDVA
jgi:hypothetical protein